MLQELLQAVDGLDEAGKEVVNAALKETEDMRWVPNPGPQTEAFFCEADELFYGGCVSGDTEYYTRAGWKRIDQFDGKGEIAQWHKEGGHFTFVEPSGFTKEPCAEMWHFTGSKVSMMLSDEHRMALYDADGGFIVKTAAEVAGTHCAYSVPTTTDNEGLDGVEVYRKPVVAKYCFKVQTSFWLARHNGFVFVTGNSAGGGKSSLAVGLALISHENSLILRRIRDDAKKLAEKELLNRILGGDRNGWNGQDLLYRGDKQRIMFGGCANEDDKQRYKGDPNDLIVFDELGDFMESQYEFITGWNRSATPGQRCRVVATGNPPTTAEGLWVISRFAPWLDPKHENPAKSGEIRWFLRDEAGEEKEVESAGPYQCGDREVYAKSRCFIRAKLEDNPDLMDDGQYETNLNNMRKDLRDAYRDGKFEASMNDHENQLIPTEWVLAAQNRWAPEPPANVPMCSIGVDVGAGNDPHAITQRFDNWFSKPELVESEPIEHGGDCAGKVLARRRDNAVIIIDCGGGFGGSAYKHFVDNHIPAIAYKGGKGTKERTKHAHIPFKNTRTASHWKLMEALDPDQPGGSNIALAPGNTMLAELTAIRFYNKNNMIQLEDKESAKKRTGLGFHESDSLVMAHSSGNTVANIQGGWGRSRTPKVIMHKRRR